jgi:predicted phage terminase large subunit-like protein
MNTATIPPHVIGIARLKLLTRVTQPAQASLLAFAQRMYPGYQTSPHIEQLCEAIEWAVSTPNARLIVTMPPRHSKSLNVSEHLPAWFLGRNPDKRVIGASHSASLAYTFSRRVRNKIADYRYPFPGISVADDKGAVQAWDIQNHQGGYVAVGVGGSPTGQGGDLIIIDDPIRGAADAESETVRDALWEWYQGTLRTRLEPNGAIIVTACMTGDTEVTMADGSVKHLKDITVGDRIATYENGRVSTSRILHWINHGPDFIYEIKTKYGKIIRANERHPFLVDREGLREWVRLRDLKAGDCLIRVLCQKGHGPASLVPTKDARSQPSARDTATRITARCDGRAVSDLHPSTMSPGVTRSSNAATASPPLSTMPWSKHRADDAPSAESSPRPIRKPSQPTERTDGSLLTIATIPARSEGYCATSATSLSVIATPKNSCSKPQPISDFTPDEIVSIAPAGIEDVFDVQVERTENFIANGVVSHNTRWHEDDLTGRLIEAQKAGGESWRHLHLEAINDQGEPLWPERWPLEALERIRSAVGTRVFEAQYQGRPAPAEGGTFKRDWWRFWATDLTPKDEAEGIVERPNLQTFDKIIQSWDMTFRETKSGSYIVGQVWGTLGADRYLLDQVRFRGDFPKAVAAVRTMSEQWPESREKIVENKANGPAIVATLRNEIPGLIEVQPEGGKEARANAVAWQVESGNVYLPDPKLHPWAQELIDEAAAFPNGAHDDQVDALSQALLRLQNRPDVWGEDTSAFLRAAFGD